MVLMTLNIPSSSSSLLRLVRRNRYDVLAVLRGPESLEQAEM
jgi:hypothetical protein